LVPVGRPWSSEYVLFFFFFDSGRRIHAGCHCHTGELHILSRPSVALGTIDSGMCYMCRFMPLPRPASRGRPADAPLLTHDNGETPAPPLPSQPTHHRNTVHHRSPADAHSAATPPPQGPTGHRRNTKGNLRRARPRPPTRHGQDDADDEGPQSAGDGTLEQRFPRRPPAPLLPIATT